MVRDYGGYIMPLNQPSGNMYPWCYTWNPIGGRCLHNCRYCYVSGKIAPWLRRMGNLKYFRPPHLIEAELETDLTVPEDFVVFPCSCNDITGWWVKREWIERILAHCREYPDVTFLFQGKNPRRFFSFVDLFPEKTILGTTFESNRGYPYTYAPQAPERWKALLNFADYFDIMISDEPIMDFDLDIFLYMHQSLEPKFVSVGADSGQNNLSEPSAEKLQAYLEGLESFTEVRKKKNLKRLLNE